MNPTRIACGILFAALIAVPAYSQDGATTKVPAAPHPTRIRIPGNTRGWEPIRLVEPEYPAEARQAHVDGTVVLHAIVANDGTVMKLDFVSGPQLLASVAIDAVKQWRYKPTLLNGQVVEVDTTISVVFVLDEQGNLKPQPKHR
jgi:TonB family protein